MTQDIEQQIVQFMQREAVQGHFEHTVNEVGKGITVSYSKVRPSLAVLAERGAVKYRERSPKRVPYYYLAELLRVVDETWGEKQ